MEDRARFIELVLSRKLDLVSGAMSAADVSAFLEAHGFGPGSADVKAAADAEATSAVTTTGGKAGLPARHARLLALPLASLTAERVGALAQDRRHALRALDELHSTSIMQLWRNDLVQLERELRKDPALAAGQNAIFSAPAGNTADDAPVEKRHLAK